MSDIYTYSFPTTIHSGPGARRRLKEVLPGLGIKRPLLVTDKMLAELTPVREITTLVQAAGLTCEVFKDIEGNPLVSHAKAGAEAFKRGEHDGVIAVGGGAALDVAKVIALMAHHPGEILDYEDGKPDARPIDKPIPPVVAIPTTAGTGSEVGRSSVVSEDDSKIKRIVFSPRLMPSVVIADGELTLELPAKVTAATGMDALTHLVEAYIAKGHHPICDGIALNGIHLVARALPKAVAFARDPKNAPREAHLDARQTMLEAAMMGAIAFQKGLGVTHSCAHALSTVCDMHHGLANGILIPYAMEFNLAAVPDRFAQMAQMAGLSQASGEAFIQWLRDLRRELGIPDHLGEAGVAREHIEALVDISLRDGCHQLNPRPVGADDFHAIFTQAIG